MTSILTVSAQARVGGPETVSVLETLSRPELLEHARWAVRHYRAGLHQPAWLRALDGDVVGDVVEACLKAQSRGTELTVAYVHAVARNLVTRDRSLCSADLRALARAAE